MFIAILGVPLSRWFGIATSSGVARCFKPLISLFALPLRSYYRHGVLSRRIIITIYIVSQFHRRSIQSSDSVDSDVAAASRKRIERCTDKDLLFPRMWSKYLNFHRQSAFSYPVPFICHISPFLDVISRKTRRLGKIRRRAQTREARGYERMLIFREIICRDAP